MTVMNTKTDPTCEVCREHPVFKDSLCAECAEIEIETLRREYNDLRADNERLRAGQYEPLRAMVDARNELAARVGQAEAQIERLRALIDTHNDECRECPVIEA